MTVVPTSRAVTLAALGLVPAVLAVVAGPLGWLALVVDVVVLALVFVDFRRAPRPPDVRVTRVVDPVVSSGVRYPVHLRFESRGPALRGAFRDSVPPGPTVEHTHQPLSVPGQGEATATWQLLARDRGDVRLGDVWVRLEGPWGLCARQFSVPAATTVKVYPDLRALGRDALSLARANDDSAKRVLRVRAEGREFESLREYRPGDDRRLLDWKATARLGRGVVRVHQPERNQTVLLMIDCGRHMAGEVLGRRKLDHAVDAALRVAKVSLDRGDQVGVMTFARTVKSWLPPAKGHEQLHALAQALYRVEATFEESDYGAALDVAFAKRARRSLVVIMTDVVDHETSSPLIKRALRLVPRHLLLIASMRDDDLHRLTLQVPTTSGEALERLVATRLDNETKATVAQLRDAGAHVLRVPAQDFGPASVNAYLDIKHRGLL